MLTRFATTSAPGHFWVGVSYGGSFPVTRHHDNSAFHACRITETEMWRLAVTKRSSGTFRTIICRFPARIA